MSANQLQIVRPDANTRVQLTVVPIFSGDDPRSKVAGSPFAIKGIYRIRYVLTVPGQEVFRDRLEFEKIMQSGASLLQAEPGSSFKAVVFNNVISAEIIFSTNALGIFSSAEMRLDAKSFDEAERSAYDLTAPLLSYWSFLHDVALDIAGYEIVEEQTEAKRYSFGIVGQIKSFKNGASFESTPERRKLLAAYREAMNSTNAFYQALSFYKVAEGVMALRKRISRKSKIPLPQFSNERMPSNVSDLRLKKVSIDELTQQAFGPYLGQTFDAVLRRLKELIRNAVAHLSQLEGVLDADKFDDVQACLKAIPVLRLMAHQLLENELGAKSA